MVNYKQNIAVFLNDIWQSLVYKLIIEYCDRLKSIVDLNNLRVGIVFWMESRWSLSRIDNLLVDSNFRHAGRGD